MNKNGRSEALKKCKLFEHKPKVYERSSEFFTFLAKRSRFFSELRSNHEHQIKNNKP